MSSIKIKKLSLKNFRSYKESEVVFPDNGLILIRGKNLDTGGSSYSGKSSIPLAIAYALGFCHLPAKEQTSWNAKTKEVSLQFEVNQKKYEIIRNDKNTKLFCDGTEVASGAKVVDEMLYSIFGISPEMVKHLTYKQQKSGSYFLSVADSDKKDFLSEVVGLSKIEDIIDVCNSANKDIEKETEKLQEIVAYQTSMVAVLDIKQPTMVDISKIQENIKTLALDFEKATNQLAEHKIELGFDISQKKKTENELLLQIEDFKTQWKEDWENFNSQLSSLNEKEAQAKAAFNQQKSELQKIYRECLKRTAKKPDIYEKLENIKQEIQSFKGNKCPTCKQSYADTQQMILARESEAIQLQNQLLVLTDIDNKSEEIEQELRKFQEFKSNPIIQDVTNKINNLELQLKTKSLEVQNAYQNKIKGLELSIRSKEIEIKNLENLVKSLNNQISTAQEQVSFAEQENTRRHEEFLVAQQELERTRISLEDNSKKLKQLNEEYNLNREIQEFLGKQGVLGSIFDEILVELNSEINGILKSVANTSHVYFEFVSENINSKGETRKQIKPVITINGYNASLYSGASGGMLSAIELAVDLAIANVVARRNNINPSWLILDESFDGMDLVSKETCLEILNKNAKDKLILVIDHATEIKEAFNFFIDVEYKNGISKIL